MYIQKGNWFIHKKAPSCHVCLFLALFYGIAFYNFLKRDWYVTGNSYERSSWKTVSFCGNCRGKGDSVKLVHFQFTHWLKLSASINILVKHGSSAGLQVSSDQLRINIYLFWFRLSSSLKKIPLEINNSL